MANLGYVFRRLLTMDYKTMFKTVKKLHKKTGKSRLFLLRDMQKCAVNYGAGYMDYDLFEMYDLTPEQRDTYLTRGRNNELMKIHNDMSFAHFFDDKAEFNTRFNQYIRREWINLSAPKEEVLSFIEKHPVFIAKPIEGMCGKGVEKIDATSYGSAEATYDALLAMDTAFELEELIIQHPAVSAIYPEAINTVRTVTIHKDGVVHIICTYFRIGNNGKHVDNFNSGGMVAPVDEETGIVKDRAIDKNKTLYEVHPYTGAAIKGFQFPDWDKMRELVTEAAKEIPEMGYLGWDVAFTPNGPCLVEGNNFPGHDIYQLPEHTPDKIGMMPKFRV
ncbi:MAG: hypothetical protein IJD01_04725 [Clostridia bacterium]|nr:hypothetical protein [Clostridia bacterium]